MSSFKEKTSRRACKSTTCKQRFQIYLKATTACRLNGTYYAYFRFKCQTKSCTYKSNRRKKITFKLKSENFCANKTVNGTKWSPPSPLLLWIALETSITTESISPSHITIHSSMPLHYVTCCSHCEQLCPHAPLHNMFALRTQKALAEQFFRHNKAPTTEECSHCEHTKISQNTPHDLSCFRYEIVRIANTQSSHQTIISS